MNFVVPQGERGGVEWKSESIRKAEVQMVWGTLITLREIGKMGSPIRNGRIWDVMMGVESLEERRSGL